ncbi:MAG: ATP-dependent zinc metalloprotease FtsH [Firmicutes bacterium]|nr:ATP-dependent zinc metalloprotease FtsH [Bacillota bacterium]
MKKNIKIIVFYVVLVLCILMVTTFLFDGMSTDKTVYSDIINLFNKEQVKEFSIDSNNNIEIITQDSKTYSFTLRDLDLFMNQVGDKIEQQYEKGIIKSYDIEEPYDIPWWVSFLPYVIVIVVFIFLWMYVMNQVGGKGGKINAFGKARTKLGSDEKKKVFFTDVAGADEEKEELEEVVGFLRDPGKFQKLGARIPRGVLLVGPPGTGKTLLAKAVAGEANVPFYSISGSDFVEMYVGVGASRVRDLFETAKKNAPAIVFIDEIDAVGRHRGAGLGGGHDEREQTLNQLLVEMDGFGNNDGVIVMAATNRPDILDPALLRPGRFDRQVTVHYPDLRGREDILKVHSKDKPFSKDVDLHEVARTTVGFTGADLANLLNEAALLAARKNKTLIGSDDIEEASIKIMVGTAKKSKSRNQHETKLTAYHEAGHAITRYYCKLIDPVKQISIIPTALTGGYTLYAPKEDKSYVSKLEMEENIISLLGGRVAEKLIMGDVSTGASNDIQRATNIARNMVTKYGMSDLLGPIVYGSEHDGDEVFLGRDFSNVKNYSEKVAAEIDDELHKIISDCFDKAEQILIEHKDKLDFVSDFLIHNETMSEAQFEKAMTQDCTREEVEKLRQDVLDSAKAENEKKRLEDEQRERELAEKLAREATGQPDSDHSDGENH